MKLVIQRVTDASVYDTELSKTVGEIYDGLFVLVGVKKGDTKKDAELLAQKLIKLRILPDKDKLMNISPKDWGAHILIVSQFTLYADTSGGNRPSFARAARNDEAKVIYEHFVEKVKEGGLIVETGSFGHYMLIDAHLDGPVTIVIES